MEIKCCNCGYEFKDAYETDDNKQIGDERFIKIDCVGRPFETDHKNKYWDGYHPDKYDVAYCENGDIILLATTTSYASTNTPIVTVDGLTLIDAKGYSQQIYYSKSYLSGIFGAIITGFTGGAITMLVKKPSNKLEITLTAS